MNLCCKSINLKTILFLVSFLICSSFVNAQISMNSNGWTKIAADLNITPYATTSCCIYPDETNNAFFGFFNQQFYRVYGQYHYATTVLLTSDYRLKENFRKIENPLTKLLQLNGKKYDFIPESSDSIGDEKVKQEKAKLKKDKLGFVAQEVEKILPEAVVYDENVDLYYIDYNAVIPVIVEAMKEQQTVIKEQQTRIETLEAKIKDVQDNAAKEKSVTIEEENSEPATLNQNIPNPFSENTTINLYLPNTVSRATLYIYNMQGEQIKYIAVNERGNTSVTIEGHTLKAGMYLYTLIADGKEVDTKKMILTK
jgi:hypothetical protein